jgi:S-layer like family, C-terminal region
MDSVAQSHPRAGKIAATEKEVTFLRRHLQEIVEGTAFRGSHRSAQFLKYIVEQAIAGKSESLKERSIGIELFGRSPSYDTGEDAIVRVTASDVRKRLLQHYGKYGTASEIRLSLPLGSYVPEVRWDSPVIEPLAMPAEGPLKAILANAVPQAPVETAQSTPPPRKARSLHVRTWVVFAVLLAGLNLAAWGVFWNYSSRTPRPISIMPWSGLFRSTGSTKVITSDPNIEKIERLSGQPISLSDYANQQYIPNPSALPPDIVRFCKDFLRGDLASTVDMEVVARIAALAQTSASRIEVRGAREIRLSDVYTDDNFIFLGSPVSNRWTSLFNNQLDFRFDLDNKQEIIRNLHPRSTENPSYVPTARGYATGQSFATISFIRNPGKSGQVLLLAGANAEGTAAAGDLVANGARFSAELKHCGVSPSGPIRYFQLLLALNTMAGSPSDVKVIACHILPGGPA